MHETNLFRLFTDPLERAGMTYMVTGSMAAMLYGEPRLTHDIDLVIELSADQIGGLEGAFPAADFYRPPEEVIREEISRRVRGHFNLIHHDSGFKADIYLRGQDPLHQWGLHKRQRLPVEDSSIWIAPPEYVILRKLQYFREGGSEKHLRDIRTMLEVSPDEIDRSELERRIESLGLATEWKMASH